MSVLSKEPVGHEDREALLRDCAGALCYEPKTGLFRWRKTFSNVRPAGTEAGSKQPAGYIIISINKRFYYAHRLAWLLVHGEWPERFIDHKNGVPGDNRIENLRLATDRQNLANRRLNQNNTSGHKGVWWHRKCKKWAAEVAGKKLGLFVTKEDAAAAYASQAKGLFGEFVRIE